MKTHISFLIYLSLLVLLSCEKEEPATSEDCVYYAYVRDFTTLDNCGFLFELENGEYIQGVWRWGFCGTPPLPEGALEDPLWGFQYEDGARLKIGFTYTNNYSSSCMKGRTAIITCIENIDEKPAEDKK